MGKCSTFSARAGMAALGSSFRPLWAEVAQRVHVRQKTITHTPIDKLLMATVNILAGGQGIVEINTRLRGDPGLLAAFGCPGCADQSVVSETLNACDATTVAQLRAGLGAVLQRHGHSVQHTARLRSPLLLDVDLTGLVAGRQGEGVTKGYFSDRKGARGRQLGRVLATDYDEVVTEHFYAGKVQLPAVLAALLDEAEAILHVAPAGREGVILRLDAGGGSDAEVELLLGRGYQLLTKATSASRSKKLAATVEEWHPDPKEPGREWGWPTRPHAYARPTQQAVVRHQRKGKWRYRVLVSTLSDAQLCQLAGQPVRGEVTARQRLFLLAAAYDKRGGGVETSFKGSKLGLGIMRRNKRRFAAQEVLVLLAALVYNFLTWVRALLAEGDGRWWAYGPLRLVRDVGGIPGLVRAPRGRGRTLRVVLRADHTLAPRLMQALSRASPPGELRVILGEI